MVPGLRRDDFRVFEDKIEQKITELSADPRPLSLVVLVDNDMKQKDADQVDAEPSRRSCWHEPQRRG